MFKKIISYFIYLLNLLAAIGLLIACIGQFFSWPAFSILALGVPILVLVNVLFFILWLVLGNKRLLVSLTVLVIGYFALGSFFRFGDSSLENSKDNLSVLSFNARGFDRYGWIGNNTDRKIEDFVKKQAADILCFQEFSFAKRNSFPEYKYRFVNREKGYSMQAIYSKYPIVNKGSLQFPKTGNNTVFVDVVINKDTVRVYNIHLQSFKIASKRDFVENKGAEGILKQLYGVFKKQEQQASLINNHRAEHSYKEIICGDFNNGQYSHIVKSIQGDMIDAFKEKGNGYGRTYNFKYFPLRIDHMFLDPSFSIESQTTFKEKLSDHFPIKATFKL